MNKVATTYRQDEAPKKQTFAVWLDTLLEEKGIDGEKILTVKSRNGTANYMPVSVVAKAMKSAPSCNHRKP